jgi:hypothetical protein
LPVFAGAATYGGARPDIGATYGSQFTNSGFTLKLAGLRPALYDLVVYAHSTVTGTFNQQQVLRLTLTANPRMSTDIPTNNATVGQPFTIAGWAIDLAAATGTGVNTLHIWAYPRGQDPVFVDVASYGGTRTDVGAAFGAQFTNSGFTLSASGLPAGTYQIVVYAYSTVAGGFNPFDSALGLAQGGQAQGLTITVQ